MNRLPLIAVLLLMCLGASAGEPMFCLQRGRTLYYERYDAKDGELRRTTTMVIGPSFVSDAGRIVDYSLTLRQPSGKEMFGGAAALSVEIDSLGTVRMDLGASLAAVLHNLFPGRDILKEGTRALLPARMRPGDTLPDAHCTVNAGPLQYRIDVTERSVLRTETVQVPAGTFDCVVVREHKVERGPGRNRNTYSDSWYCPGVGYVRHDTYDRNLRPDTSEVLKKY
ncbi:MAG: hypothetical protein K5910_07955 [Bacteroidales bacterium]|nr:hypothetical protein [Bacteroidales bacterium]